MWLTKTRNAFRDLATKSKIELQLQPPPNFELMLWTLY